ncbi:MAG: trigger factor [Rugosibacter sp.]|nr:trigger factor [Rugosibacter sp.]
MTDTATEMATQAATTEAVAAPVSPLERRLDISITLADIEGDIGARLKNIARTVKMPGFRPGKVPMSLVEKNYGGQARSEAIGVAVESALESELKAQNMRVAGYPNIQPVTSEGGGKLNFTATFEVYPAIALGDVSGQSVERPALVVTEAEVEQTLDVLRKQRMVYSEVQRAAQKDDRIVIDFVGRKDGVEFPGGKADNHTMTVGADAMLPDFEAAVVGMSAGDKKTFDLTFPADYQAKDLAGSTVQFDVTVNKVEAAELPALDAAFAKALGSKDGDMDAMRVEIRANLEREVKKRLEAKTKQQVMDALLAVNSFDVPKALVDAESRQMADAAVRDMEARGMAVKGFPIDPAWFADKAIRRVKLGLLLTEVVKAHDLYAKPEQVRAVVDEFSASFEDPTEVVRWYYSQPQRLAEAEALAVENNVVEWVLKQVKVIDKSVAFDELMGNAG